MSTGKCYICGNTPVIAHGWCNKHYRRWRTYGDPEATPHHVKSTHTPGSLEHLIENSAYVDGPLDTQCRVWIKATTKAGYGVVGSKPKLQYAHRLAYELEIGPMGEMSVLHRCDNPPCNNTDHLFLGDDKANSDDMIAKGRANKRYKLTTKQVQEIKDSGLTNKELAAKFEVAYTTITGIKNGNGRPNG